ncbi:hypothetical protein S40285_07335 [Stachybotrys chlorohalonatus IBT 40285]|uniref:Thiaminase-2/PQQC domain-containing protein n=1 Tax=Stachybotrys chlorohalonatus (strain IBT 40285) TaxID=1283841 RepID=A0A084Q8C4_STAC4|nr:hypothetical protein S40285_07335 [Stachybotrys chlorohalonata IBT 40285]
MAAKSLTRHLLEAHAEPYARATQAPFLAAAARGQLSKDTLGQWLANDRLYIHAYIGGIGRLLAFLDLPDRVADLAHSSNVKFLTWVTEALVNLQREEKFFIDTAAQYGLTIDLPSKDMKLDGLKRFEILFESIAPSEHIILPWLEAAIVFYATEKCYLDAWRWAKAEMEKHGNKGDDADGGALRRMFIPQWSNSDFAQFVDRLGSIIDGAVARELKLHGEGVRAGLIRRAEATWHEVLVAEEAFWPKV